MTAAQIIEEIKRLYGWMASHDPGTTDWEGIGPGGSLYEGGFTSAAHGWATGVLPALTNDLLGVTPTGPGFSTWTVRPRPGPVAWARGQVPTPHGSLTVSWVTAAARTGFRATFATQYSRFCLGTLAPRGQSWPCQKQPWTKRASLRPAITTSGLPGRSARCSR